MPIKQQAKEALRKTKRHLARNTKVREDLKTLLKKIRKDIDSQKVAKDIEALIKQAQKSIDKAAQKGVIKKNTAGRKLSRLIKYYKKGSKTVEKKESTSALASARMVRSLAKTSKATADKEKK